MLDRSASIGIGKCRIQRAGFPVSQRLHTNRFPVFAVTVNVVQRILLRRRALRAPSQAVPPAGPLVRLLARPQSAESLADAADLPVLVPLAQQLVKAVSSLLPQEL